MAYKYRSFAILVISLFLYIILKLITGFYLIILFSVKKEEFIDLVEEVSLLNFNIFIDYFY